MNWRYLVIPAVIGYPLAQEAMGMKTEETRTETGKRANRGQVPSAPITESLTGILKGDWDLEQVKEERMREKYGLPDR